MANDESRKPRRTVVLPPKSDKIADAQIVPEMNQLLNDTLVIIGGELARYRSKVKGHQSLSVQEARVVQGYLESLIRANKERREAIKDDKLSELTDQEFFDQLPDELKRRLLEDLKDQS